MKRAFITSAGSSIGFITLWTACAWALSVSPARTDVRLDPGTVTRVVLTVTNTTSEKRVVKLSSKPWFKYPDNINLRVEDWLKLPKKKQFSLKPGKSKDVTVELQCPKDAVGELMGMVSFASQPDKESMLTSMVSAPIYLRVIGTEKNTGELLAVGAGTRKGVFQVGAQIKATGNVRLRPVGIIQLVDAQGAAVADYVMPEATPIFPGQAMDCLANGPAAPPPAGRYVLKANLKSGSLDLSGERRIRVQPNGDVELEK
jgi:hypothetical protein